VDHTLRLIQHNWVVLAYNLNIVILVLIIGEPSIGAFLLSIFFSFNLVVTSHYYFIPALAEYQSQVWSTLLFSPATQSCCSEGEMVWNSSMKSSRLCVAPVVVVVELWSLLLFHFVESHHSL
jgi:hypothetical protein